MSPDFIDGITADQLDADPAALRACLLYGEHLKPQPRTRRRKPLTARRALLTAGGVVGAAGCAAAFMAALGDGSVAAWLLLIAGTAALALVKLIDHEIGRHAGRKI